VAFKFAPGQGGRRGAYDRLVTLLSDDPTAQDLLRDFLNSVAYKSEMSFLGLSDVPKTYAQAAGKPVVVGDQESGLEFGSMPAGLDTFLALTDTPDTYVDQGEKLVSVKADESGLEFTSAAGGDGSYPYFKGGKITQSGTTSVSAAEWTSPNFDTSEDDSGDVVDLGDDRLVVPEDGYYLIIFRFDVGDLTGGIG
jgi:hypothetical protein